MTTPSQVSIGPSSILGWLAAAAGLVTSTVQSLESSQALVSGPGKWPAILGVGTLVATNIGRQFQAAHLTKAAVIASDVAAAPGVLEQLAAAAKANAAAAVPDGVDSAHVPFATLDQPAQSAQPAQV